MTLASCSFQTYRARSPKYIFKVVPNVYLKIDKKTERITTIEVVQGPKTQYLFHSAPLRFEPPRQMLTSTGVIFSKKAKIIKDLKFLAIFIYLKSR